MGLKSFINILRRIKWDLTGPHGYYHKQAWLAPIPGYLGKLLRERFYRKWLRNMGEGNLFYEKVNIIYPRKLTLGSHCNIGTDVEIQANGDLTIGDYVVLGPSAKIWTSNHIFADSDRPISTQGAEYKPVVIGDDVWIGASAFIMPGARIGNGCVISAGAVVGGKTYKDFSILAGNPARVIGFRNAVSEKTETKATGDE